MKLFSNQRKYLASARQQLKPAANNCSQEHQTNISQQQ